jgi:hypothetical protein
VGVTTCFCTAQPWNGSYASKTTNAERTVIRPIAYRLPGQRPAAAWSAMAEHLVDKPCPPRRQRVSGQVLLG